MTAEQTLQLESPWSEVKEKIKEVHASLTDEDLAYEPGQDEALLDRLSQKLKKNKATIKAWIESVSYNRGKAS